ncbi:ornithine cyclodeaminase [Eubacteriales bacterium OttesenSCG-928-M02]|nr:ornithine cyclodeaminase [Eubacteriales bacterium OttesenSCG-928-M02]
MKIIGFDTMKGMGISPKTCVDWVREGFLGKKEALLPKKISLSPKEGTFFNFMPTLLPGAGVAGVKVVSRMPGRVPTLEAQILLYDGETGEALALMDGTYITAMRTGAVAALAVEVLAVPHYREIGLIGMGNCGTAALLCLLDKNREKELTVKLYRYKDYHKAFIRRFQNYQNITFQVVDTYEAVIKDSDVILSAVTYQEEDFVTDLSLFQEGCLVVPIHTRGFMGCDTVFDRVIVDDVAHVHGFRYFDQFRYLAELTDVLLGEKMGRGRDKERILAYNIGLSIHDILFARRYYERLMESGKAQLEEISLGGPGEKQWI